MLRMYAALYVAGADAPEALPAVARDCSPRIEVHGPREVTLDLSGLSRLFGDARAMGEELLRTAAAQDLRVRAAIAATRTAARLLARGAARPLTVLEPGDEPAAIAPLPLRLLAALDADPADAARLPVALTAFEKWGLSTLGEVAALPADAVAARLGQDGVRWQRLARGEDPRPLLPSVPEERFEQAFDLEWPIEGLEPLSFVLGRLMEPLAAHLDRRGRGAAVLHVRLHLVTRVLHERSLELPAPIKDARTLRTLALLDLESHPPSAAIDRVVVAVDPTPARIVQFSLLARPLPSPEQMSTLMARLGALLGADRCGAPAVVESWRPGAFAVTRFAPNEAIDHSHGTPRQPPPALSVTPAAPGSACAPKPEGAEASAPPWPLAPVVVLRRFRFPIPARVRVDGEAAQARPVRVTTDRRGLIGGRVARCAGPWRTSGEWWERPWDRDEWDVTLADDATWRVFRDRGTGAWFLEGVFD